jgi:MscS family membrane protein
MLAAGIIENYASRGRILMQSTLRLRYGTTVGQLQVILDETRQLIAAHPTLDRASARIRLVAFGAQAIELELFAFVTTADFAAFLGVREGLLMQVAQIVEAAGTAFASPLTPGIDMGTAPVKSPGVTV